MDTIFHRFDRLRQFFHGLRFATVKSISLLAAELLTLAVGGDVAHFVLTFSERHLETIAGFANFLISVFLHRDFAKQPMVNIGQSPSIESAKESPNRQSFVTRARVTM